MEDISKMSAENNSGRNAMILRYVSLAAGARLEGDQGKLSKMAEEREELERALGMSSQEILDAALGIISPDEAH